MSHISVGTLIDLFSVLGALFAVWKGGAAERATAMAVIVNVVIGQTGQFLVPDSGGLIRLVNDGLTALVLLAITLRYGAVWMGGVMLFYAAQFSLHSYYLVTGRPDADYLHALINNIDYIGIISCLIFGTIVAWRARLRRARAAKAVAAQAAT